MFEYFRRDSWCVPSVSPWDEARNYTSKETEPSLQRRPTCLGDSAHGHMWQHNLTPTRLSQDVRRSFIWNLNFSKIIMTLEMTFLEKPLSFFFFVNQYLYSAVKYTCLLPNPSHGGCWQVKTQHPWREFNKQAPVLHTHTCSLTHTHTHTCTDQRPLCVHFPPSEQFLSSPVNLTNPLGIHYRDFMKSSYIIFFLPALRGTS